MRALVDQFAAARDFGLGAPFLLVAEPSAVTVAGADEHQRPEHAGIDDLARFQERRMEAMIEPGLDDALVPRGGRRDGLHFGERASRGLLDENMAAGFDRAERDAGELIVRGRNNHGIDVGLHGFAPVGDGARLRESPRAARARLSSRSQTTTISCACRRDGTLAPDQPASDDREPHHFLSHDSPRSAGTIRRSV